MARLKYWGMEYLPIKSFLGLANGKPFNCGFFINVMASVSFVDVYNFK